MIHVLVVDDDSRVARIHAQFVSRTPGFAVDAIVHSAREAKARVEEAQPDLVLLDIYLPDGNGLDLLREWRAAGFTLGVIVITAAREAEAVRAALAGGASRYVIKPFEYDDLEQALRSFREQREAVESLAEASQGEVDRIFGLRPQRAERQKPLPKGLSVETAQLIRETLAAATELSASECSERTGISRVSVRRYLEYFVDDGVATVRLQYGRSGRPTRYYALR